MTSHAIPTHVRAADFYRGCGWNALPSQTDRKKPPMTYAHLWERPAPRSLFRHFPAATNVQVMTGVYWGLAVLDIDGPEALGLWADLCRLRGEVRTWESGHDDNGRHVWFALPPGTGPLPRRVVWERPDVKHSKVEFLCDRSLVVAPPSHHVGSGSYYVFLPGRSPLDLARPAVLPAWLLDLCKPPPPAPRPAPVRRAGYANSSARYRTADVLAAIPDPIGVAASWGLRLAAARPNHSGWQRCHAINRPDRDPSASISIRGSYWEPALGRSALSLFDLGASLGVYPSWQDAANALGHAYGAPVREVRN